MTTIEYDRTLEIFKHLKQIKMSVADYIAQGSLFTPDSAEQLALLRRLESKSVQTRSAMDQTQLF